MWLDFINAQDGKMTKQESNFLKKWPEKEENYSKEANLILIQLQELFYATGNMVYTRLYYTLILDYFK